MRTPTRWTACLIASCISLTGFVQSAQATLVTTEQVAASQGLISPTAQRAHVNSVLERAEVATGLQERGVSVEQARARVAALTDDEVAQVSHTLDTAPAGAADVLGVILTIFVVLLITDVLGFTKIFPFTRSIR